VLLKQPRLGGVLLRCGRLHLDFDDRHLDEIVNGNETDEPVSLHHGNVAAGASSLTDRSRAKAPAPKDASSKVRSQRGLSDRIGMRQNAVDALSGISQGICLSWGQTSQSGSRQNGQICARWIDAYAPL